MNFKFIQGKKWVFLVNKRKSLAYFAIGEIQNPYL